MKYSTAVGRLRSVAADLSSLVGWEGFPIVEAHVYGDLIDAANEVDLISLAFVVDRPVEEVTWLARPAHLEAVASQLRLDKLPTGWRWRPSAWLAWNHEIVGPVAFWSKDVDTDESALEALGKRRLTGLRYGPGDEVAFEQQLRGGARGNPTPPRGGRRFLSRSRMAPRAQRIRRVPEDRLWWATKGVLDLEAALSRARHREGASGATRPQANTWIDSSTIQARGTSSARSKP